MLLPYVADFLAVIVENNDVSVKNGGRPHKFFLAFDVADKICNILTWNED